MSTASSTSRTSPPERILNAFLTKRAIPHALLFTGLQGVGKRRTALSLAMACNCEAFTAPGSGERVSGEPVRDGLPACGACKPCRKIAAGSHPDVILVEPAGAIIKIDQVRDLCRTLAMKPYEARWRVVVISRAQTLNPSAGNALLKMLEEPPDRTVMVLLAEQPSDLLPTIVSRCQHIRFRPAPLADLAEDLTRTRAIPQRQAEILAFMAKGCPDQAAAMADGNWFARRTWLLDRIGSLPETPLPGILALAERLARDKDALEETLDILLSWLRDVAVAGRAPEKIIHKDLTDTIRCVSQRTDVPTTLSRMRAVENVQHRLRTHANIRLALESLMLELAGDGQGT